MKLAFSTNAYMKHPFDDAARRVSELGYDGLELLADVPHAWPAGLLAGAKQAILDTMHRYSLAFSNVNAFMMNAIADPRQPYWYPSFIDQDPHYRQIRVDHTKRAIELCAELGAPHITTEPGGPLDGQPRSKALDLFVEVLKPLAEHAHKLGVLLLVEPEPGLLIETTDEYLELAEKLNAPSVGLNFDVGHAFCMSEDLPKAIEKLAPYTRHYHFEDIAATRVHHHLVPGEGAIDFAEVVAAIKKTGYDGWLTVELYPYIDSPDAAASRAREVLKPLIDAAAN